MLLPQLLELNEKNVSEKSFYKNKFKFLPTWSSASIEEEENNFAISDPQVIQVLEKLSIGTFISFLQEIPDKQA